MKGTTIFLAGGEVETLTDALINNGAKFILYSYYYILTMRRTEYILRMQEEHPEIWWLLDSGAFTYSVQAQLKPLPPPEEYVRLYFKFIDRFGDRWWRVTEPDLDGIEGMDVTNRQVRAWREEMLTRWPHLPIMPCYHGWRGEREFQEYLDDKRIKYLALGRGCGGDDHWRRLTMKAQYHKKPVHGFGYTRINTALSQGVNVDSVDSTSWVMGQKFGSIYIMRGDKLITLTADEKGRRREFAAYFRGLGCDPKLIEEDNVAEVRKANIRTWVNIAARFHSLKGRRDKVLKMNEFAELDKDGLPIASLSGIAQALERDADFLATYTGNPEKPRPLERVEGLTRGEGVREPPKPRILGMFGAPIQDQESGVRPRPIYRPPTEDY